MPENCIDESAEVAKAGDRYYKVIGEWIRGRMRSETLRRQAGRLAEMYLRSLDLLIKCYRRIRGSAAAKKEIHHAVELKTLLKKDMEILGLPRGEVKARPTQSEQ